VSDVPDRPGGDEPDDPFAGLPPELRAMFEQLGGPEGLARMQEQLSGLLGGLAGGGMPFGFAPTPGPTGPVDWELATRVALQVAADGDRSPITDEERRATDAFQLAEHWLDATPLPSPPDAGRLVVGSRQRWVNGAIEALKPLVEPVARATTDGLVDLAREQFSQLADDEELDLSTVPGMEALPPGFADLVRRLLAGDPGEMLRPASAALAGLQAGQVIGQLSRQLLGSYDLGIPTGPRAEAHHLAVNVAETFEGYELDLTEVAVVLALDEAAHRRLYHAVPWLEAHVGSLVARFAAGTTVTEERLREVSDELMLGVDPDDPEALRAAMERAANFRLEPTPDQHRILERLQGVVCLIGAWARHEVARASEGRLPSMARIAEVLRRRRATRGDGEELLADLLGLDIKPDDESIGERFVVAVEEALGPAGLWRALAHPENLPDADELADPTRWLARTADDVDIPDDPAALFTDLGAAPHEDTADERAARLREDADGSDQGGHGDDDRNGDDEAGSDDEGGPDPTS
jgi:putative hydrolase